MVRFRIDNDRHRDGACSFRQKEQRQPGDRLPPQTDNAARTVQNRSSCFGFPDDRSLGGCRSSNSGSDRTQVRNYASENICRSPHRDRNRTNIPVRSILPRQFERQEFRRCNQRDEHQQFERLAAAIITPHCEIGSRLVYEGEFMDREGSCRRNCDHRRIAAPSFFSKLHDQDDEQHDK